VRAETKAKGGEQQYLQNASKQWREKYKIDLSFSRARSQLVNLFIVSSQPIIIQTITNHEFVWDTKAEVIDLQRVLQCFRLIK
jgi:hypothetical protein